MTVAALTDSCSEEEIRMETVYKEIYSSSNGDRWLLAREAKSGKVFVKHEANVASGGFGSQMELDVFLTREKHSPQVNRLIALIGSLVPESAD